MVYSERNCRPHKISKKFSSSGDFPDSHEINAKTMDQTWQLMSSYSTQYNWTLHPVTMIHCFLGASVGRGVGASPCTGAWGLEAEVRAGTHLHNTISHSCQQYITMASCKTAVSPAEIPQSCTKLSITVTLIWTGLGSLFQRFPLLFTRLVRFVFWRFVLFALFITRHVLDDIFRRYHFSQNGEPLSLVMLVIRLKRVCLALGVSQWDTECVLVDTDSTEVTPERPRLPLVPGAV